MVTVFFMHRMGLGPILIHVVGDGVCDVVGQCEHTITCKQNFNVVVGEWDTPYVEVNIVVWFAASEKYWNQFQELYLHCKGFFIY